MSGKHITQLEETIYMKNLQAGCTQETSAAKAMVVSVVGKGTVKVSGVDQEDERK